MFRVPRVKRFIKAVGSGQKRARALTREEAREAMMLLAEGQCDPIQLGAFLLAMRMKGESADELAGFADALSAYTIRFTSPEGALDVDGHGDGHEGLVSLLPAAMCAAASLGVPVCLHVESGAPFARHGLDAGLEAIGLGGVLDPRRAERDLLAAGVAACDLVLGCPPLARLVSLRRLLGVRTVAQTLAKLVSPSTARRRLVGIFHAPYLEPTAAALGALGVERGVVAQALGGLPEARPGRITRIADAASARAAPFDLRDFVAFSTANASTPARSTIALSIEERAPLGGAAESLAANCAALDGEPAAARLAAATAALMLFAAHDGNPAALADAAFAAFTSGRARAVALRLGR